MAVTGKSLSLSPMSVEAEEYWEMTSALQSLLSTARPQGYGGALTFGECRVLGTYLGLSPEAIEDCWYDTLQGAPCSEVTDIDRLSHFLLCYCMDTGSTALRLPPHALLSEDTIEAEMRALFAAIEEEGEEETVLSSPSEINVEPQTQTPPPAPSPHLVQSPRSDSHHPYRRVKKKGTSPVLAEVPPRYTMTTSSSQSKSTTRKVRGPAAAPSSPPRRTSSVKKKKAGSEVYDRLYAQGVEHQKKKLASREAPIEELPETTARPSSAPRKKKSSSPSHRAKSPMASTYNKPTKAFYARLMGQPDTAYDPIEQCPETERVAYHPAPGPPSYVPPGYVEEVAKRRREALRRLEYMESNAPLKGPDWSNTIEVLRHNAILRLPISADRKEAVDVHLDEF